MKTIQLRQTSMTTSISNEASEKSQNGQMKKVSLGQIFSCQSKEKKEKHVRQTDGQNII